MIDNSASMGDKQAYLAQAIPDLLSRLVTPNCLDVNGNPVPYFADPSSSSKSAEISLRAETSSVKYLDMGIESKGYIYVLKLVGDASQPANYMLDIYQPDGPFLVQTKGVTAGKMAVSFWRDVYTLNYEQISGPNGPEPSVSKWIPPAPAS